MDLLSIDSDSETLTATDASARPKGRVRLVRSMHAVRVATYAYCLVVFGLLAHECGYGTGTYALLALQFLSGQEIPALNVHGLSGLLLVLSFGIAESREATAQDVRPYVDELAKRLLAKRGMLSSG